MKVLITGGTGFIGAPLCEELATAHAVRCLSRRLGAARPRFGPGVEVVPWPASPAAWAAALEGCDAAVNLAGEPIGAGRWTDARKRRIRSSRIEATRELVQAIGATAPRLRVLVSGSAIGYYGDRGDEAVDESAPPGTGFLADVCAAWEREADAAEGLGVRVVRVRTGLVLGAGGGALEKMLPPFRLYVGGPLGSGGQWMSWIHLADQIGLIRLALEHEAARGPLNATAPAPRRMGDFCRALGAAVHRPSWAPVPSFALRMLLGEMADMLLTGQRVLPAAAERLGYRFRYSTLEAALAAILGPAHR